MPTSKVVDQPVHFANQALMGWLHRVPAAADSAPKLGVVLCAPFGYEAICARRSLRAMATSFAAAGVPTLRFDYHGTGDSAGDDRDPQRVAVWQASIVAAIEELRASTGVQAVALVGVRLGALLAAQVAAARDDIAAFVAIAPVMNGKAYVRELRALQMALGLNEPPAGLVWDKPAREAVGFAVTEETAAELSTLTMLPERAVAPRVRVVDRSDLSIGDAWPNAQRNAGADVTIQPFTGYATMVLDPHKVVVPAGMINELTTWLVGLAPAATPFVPAAPADARAINAVRFGAPSSTFVEAPMQIAGRTSLFGVVTTPRAAKAQHAVLMLNAGAVHHVGPNRLYVALARRLATAGVASLRMDIAGIGDSRAANGIGENVVYPPTAVDDVLAAVTALRNQFQSVSVVGLCAGAYHGFKAAFAGAAVQRAVIINPLTYFWAEGMSLDIELPDARVVEAAKEYQASMLSLAKWRKLLRGDVNVRKVAQIIGKRLAQRGQHAARDVARRVGVRLGDDLGFEIASTTQRGVTLHFVFAKSDPGLAMLREQGGAVVPQLVRSGAISIDVIDGPDHTFTACWTHDVLLRKLEQLLTTAR
jgi:alpha/beta superfamily hydrolase